MAEKKSKPVLANRKVRIALMLLLTVTSATLAVLTMVFGYRALYTDNRHFLLRKVVVTSAGWWNGREEKIVSDLKLAPGETNLFALDLAALRKRLLTLEPSIAGVIMRRVLPDTLVININERIPRAFLGNGKSEWLVDDSGMVMSRRFCVDISNDLPVITPPDGKFRPGRRLPGIASALLLLRRIREDYPAMRITAVKVRKNGELDFVLYYRGVPRPYVVRMPGGRISYMLEVLRTALKKAVREKNPNHKVNLLFKGQVVFEPLRFRKR